MSTDFTYSPSADGQPAVFDVTLTLHRVGGDRDFLRELVDVFMTEYPKLLLQIEGAVIQNDAATLRRAAHTLKGAMNNFGAQSACALALRLEEMGRDQQLTDAWSTLEQLRPQVEKLQQTLRDYIATP